jgi:hypothetical protein
MPAAGGPPFLAIYIRGPQLTAFPRESYRSTLLPIPAPSLCEGEMGLGCGRSRKNCGKRISNLQPPRCGAKRDPSTAVTSFLSAGGMTGE